MITILYSDWSQQCIHIVLLFALGWIVMLRVVIHCQFHKLHLVFKR